MAEKVKFVIEVDDKRKRTSRRQFKPKSQGIRRHGGKVAKQIRGTWK
jgi:hypothetical protein